MAGPCCDDVVAGFIKLHDLEGLQQFTPSNYDWTRDVGEFDLPPLVLLICEDVSKPTTFLKCAEWMIQSGADPQQKAKPRICYSWWKNDNKDATKVSIELAGRSAISLAFERIRVFKEGKGGANWSVDIKRMQDFVAMAARHQVPISHCALDLNFN